MRILFIHQNFPGQFKHLVFALANAGHEVVGLGQQRNLKQKRLLHPRLKIAFYPDPRPVNEHTHSYLRQMEEQTLRGQAVYRACSALAKKGFEPDVVYVHPGWGESLFLKQVFPKARLLLYLEFYYNAEGADFGFDPEFPITIDDRCRHSLKNFPQILGFEHADLGIAPTAWQKSRYPLSWQSRIVQLHDGIDSTSNKPNANAKFSLNIDKENGTCETLLLGGDDEVVTYVARNLEPYRGIHTLMRAIPKLLELRPNARVLIVGGDSVSYGRRAPNGESYRALYTREWKGNVDTSRVHFLGRLAYEQYQCLLQISSLHIYLTYPFVLSWSLLEAMSSGCLVLASNTGPVTEVIEHGKTGFLTDFFDHNALANEAGNLLAQRSEFNEVRKAARELIVSKYELSSHLKEQVLLITGSR